jgi:transcriptional antiterminator
MNTQNNRTKKRLTGEALMKLTKKPVLRAMLAEHFNVSTYTIERYIKRNDPYLCFSEALSIIANDLGQPETDLIETFEPKREGVEL